MKAAFSARVRLSPICQPRYLKTLNRILLSRRFTSTETIRLIRDGRMEVGKEGDYMPIAISGCHHHNDSCIKNGSDKNHFNVSLIVRDTVTRQCPQTTTFLKRRESGSGIEPRPFCLPAERLTAGPNRFTKPRPKHRAL